MIAVSTRQVVAKGVNADGKDMTVMRGMSESMLDELSALPFEVSNNWLSQNTVNYLQVVHQITIDHPAQATKIIFMVAFVRPHSERKTSFIGSWVGSEMMPIFVFDILDCDEADEYVKQQVAE